MTLKDSIIDKTNQEGAAVFSIATNSIQKENLVKNLNGNKISIIIPIYNEEHSIKDVINRIPNHYQYEVIIVDDGSIDNSVKNAKESNRECKIICHKTNQGYGAAILTGFKHAKGDIIVTMDSDGQHDPEEIITLIGPILNKQADIVVGSRYLGKSNYKVPLHTRVGEWCVQMCLRLLYHQKVTNNQSGFRAFSAKSIELLHDMVYTKFGLCTETLFKAAYHKLKIVEIPITIDSRKYGSSKIKINAILKSIISCILVYFLARFKFMRFFPERIQSKLHYIFSKFLKIVT